MALMDEILARSTRDCTRLSWASSWVVMLAARLGVRDELESQGYEFDHRLSKGGPCLNVKIGVQKR